MSPDRLTITIAFIALVGAASMIVIAGVSTFLSP